LKRVIQRNLENPLANEMLQGRIADGATINISAGEDGLIIAGQKVRVAA
jgi:ATP-dependent Clp protease ATP-binding subunit ClpB